MDHGDEVPKGESPVRRAKERDEQAAELAQKVEDLEVFRDAGVLTDAEMEEQKVRLRWGLP